MYKKLIFIFQAFPLFFSFSIADFKTSGADMRNSKNFLGKLTECMKWGKENLKQDDKVGWKINIDENKALVSKEKIYPEYVGHKNLLRLLEKISNGEPVDHIGFYENSNIPSILLMLSVKNGQIRNEEPVRIVFMPLDCHHLIHDIGQLNKQKLQLLADSFVKFIKDYNIENPEFECNFGIGSEKYVHWTLKSQTKNSEIEQLKEMLVEGILLKEVQISDEFRSKIKANLQQIDDENKIKPAKSSNKVNKKVKFAEQIEQVLVEKELATEKNGRIKWKTEDEENANGYKSLKKNNDGSLIIEKLPIDYNNTETKKRVEDYREIPEEYSKTIAPQRATSRIKPPKKPESDDNPKEQSPNIQEIDNPETKKPASVLLKEIIYDSKTGFFKKLVCIPLVLPLLFDRLLPDSFEVTDMFFGKVFYKLEDHNALQIIFYSIQGTIFAAVWFPIAMLIIIIFLPALVK